MDDVIANRGVELLEAYLDRLHDLLLEADFVSVLQVVAGEDLSPVEEEHTE